METKLKLVGEIIQSKSYFIRMQRNRTRDLRIRAGPSSTMFTEFILARADECLNLEISYQQIMQDLSILKDKRLINSSAAFYNGYIIDGFYITDSRIRRKRPCSLIENEFVYSSSSCSRIVI